MIILPLGTYTGLKRRVTRCCIIGDSTIDVPTAYPLSVTPLKDWIYYPEEFAAGCTVQNLALGGDTITGQKAKWDALTSANKLTFDFVICQIGLNDYPNTLAQNITNYQAMVNAIRASVNADCKIIISKMIPVKNAQPAPVEANQAKWVGLNDAIAGSGATPITGVDGRITAHVPLLDDGNGSLQSKYVTQSFDPVHENNLARALIIKIWRETIDALLYV